MLTITVPAKEYWDEVHERFVETKEQTLELEHSLVALSKWEAKWHKSFLKKRERSTEEMIDYIRCMTLTKNVDPRIYSSLTVKNINDVIDYLEDPMTATYITEDKKTTGSKETVTAELIYYWMISYNIPVAFENWHLNRLLTLIRVCDIKNSPKKKRTMRDLLSRTASVNAMRRAELAKNSKGGM